MSGEDILRSGLLALILVWSGLLVLILGANADEEWRHRRWMREQKAEQARLRAEREALARTLEPQRPALRLVKGGRS